MFLGVDSWKLPGFFSYHVVNCVPDTNQQPQAHAEYAMTILLNLGLVLSQYAQTVLSDWLDVQRNYYLC